VGLSIVLLRLRRNQPGLLAAWVSYLVVLAPSSGLIRTGPMFVADRYSYLPTMALFMPAAAAFAVVLSRGRRHRLGCGVAIIGLVLVATLVPVTWRQCRVWRDSTTPWEHSAACLAAAVQANPASAEAHHNLGIAHYHCGRLDEAIGEFRSALRIDPAFAQAWGSLGQVLADSGRADQAIEALTKAVNLDPESPELHAGLAVVLLKQGLVDEALIHYAEASRREPGNSDWHIGLGMALFRQGRLDEADGEISSAIRLAPDNPLTRDYLQRIRKARGAR
jgi:Flp pilus assembly protein TadD